jgi:hypothetical protein
LTVSSSYFLFETAPTSRLVFLPQIAVRLNPKSQQRSSPYTHTLNWPELAQQLRQIINTVIRFIKARQREKASLAIAAILFLGGYALGGKLLPELRNAQGSLQLSGVLQVALLVILMGESGAGKTSLLRAGLPHILAGKGVKVHYWEAVPTDWRTCNILSAIPVAKDNAQSALGVPSRTLQTLR